MNQLGVGQMARTKNPAIRGVVISKTTIYKGGRINAMIEAAGSAQLVEWRRTYPDRNRTPSREFEDRRQQVKTSAGKWLVSGVYRHALVHFYDALQRGEPIDPEMIRRAYLEYHNASDIAIHWGEVTKHVVELYLNEGEALMSVYQSLLDFPQFLPGLKHRRYRGQPNTRIVMFYALYWAAAKANVDLPCLV